MKNYRLFLVLSLVLMLSLLFAACGDEETSSKTTTGTLPSSGDPAMSTTFLDTSAVVTTKPTVSDTVISGTSAYPVRIALDGIDARQPYGEITGGAWRDKTYPFSPDPLAAYEWKTVSANDDLQIFHAFPIAYTASDDKAFEGLSTLLTDNVNLKIKGNGRLMLDFGVEFAAWLEIRSDDLDPSAIKLAISEYTEPGIVNLGPQSPEKIGRPQAIGGGWYRLVLNSELYEGVRFAFLDIENFKKEFSIDDIRLVSQVKPVNYTGSFSSDNEMLDKIWYTAAYDVRVNLKKDYFAAILMDRGDRHSWTGDAYTAQAAALVAFSNYDFVLKNLEYTAVRPNGIESYELYWVLSLIDYYEYTGDKVGVNKLLNHALSRLNHAYSGFDKDRSLGFFGWDERLGAGFENPSIALNQLSYRLIAIQCFKEFAEVLDDLGKSAFADRYRGYAEEKTEWLLENDEWYKEIGIHAFADAVNAGVTSDAIENELFERYFTDRANRLSYSPFNEYFLLQALVNMGKYDDAISSILDLWGGQIAYGGTTFFETFRPDWETELSGNAAVPNNQAGYTSLAHPWSAGVLTVLSEDILGIRATAPGFATFSVLPHPGTFLTRLSGSVTTPKGEIAVSFDMTKGLYTVTVPQDTKATIGIPKAGRTVVLKTVNGKSAKADREDGDFLYLDNLTAGNYEIVMTYSGSVTPYEAPDTNYPASFLGRDDKTQGDWSGVYGADGYLLCGGRRVLPDYVSAVTFSKAITVSASSVKADKRAPMANPFGIGDRHIAYAATNDNNACWQTFSLDIRLKENQTYTVALYFVDYEREGKRLAVELFDAKTLELIAPVKVLDDCTGGVYMIYECDRSVRFRIDHIRGKNVSLAGIFFGKGEAKNTDVSYVGVDDADAAVSYTGSGWKHDSMGDAYNGTFSYSKTKGDACSYTFVGDNFTLYMSRESNRGICEIFLDGKSLGKFDLYSETILRQEKIVSKTLEKGEHTVKIVVTGEKHSKATDCYVDIDAFEHKTAFVNETTLTLDDRDESFVYTGSWTHDPIGNAYGGTFSYSNSKGNAVEITVSGSEIALIASKESNRGICEIFLDGISQGKVDLYSPSIERQLVIFAKSGLSEGEHKVKIVVTGEKNPHASGSYVDVDAIRVTKKLYTVKTVSESVRVTLPAENGEKLAFSKLPSGFSVTIKASSDPTCIALDGKVTYPAAEQHVKLTITVSDGKESLDRTIDLVIKP